MSEVYQHISMRWLLALAGSILMAMPLLTLFVDYRPKTAFFFAKHYSHLFIFFILFGGLFLYALWPAFMQIISFLNAPRPVGHYIYVFGIIIFLLIGFLTTIEFRNTSAPWEMKQSAVETPLEEFSNQSFLEITRGTLLPSYVSGAERAKARSLLAASNGEDQQFLYCLHTKEVMDSNACFKKRSDFTRTQSQYARRSKSITYWTYRIAFPFQSALFICFFVTLFYYGFGGSFVQTFLGNDAYFSTIQSLFLCGALALIWFAMRIIFQIENFPIMGNEEHDQYNAIRYGIVVIGFFYLAGFGYLAMAFWAEQPDLIQSTVIPITGLIVSIFISVFTFVQPEATAKFLSLFFGMRSTPVSIAIMACVVFGLVFLPVVGRFLIPQNLTQ